ncbi:MULTISPECIES: phosphate ABC transporter permease PstA [unclassified Rathayibacter]|uniref:phosphate ABC transporter permease PstA n=1 Tax=unclassified Rathayibacter TaxID=2609250 RepID=UPI00188CF388|nr:MULTISPECIES: phosphate ABC transporter permease PstA [unclassified Rathayibacter]MBF4462741.1 phosphate ABC transporter permease PstA [Rathayibacter sp. VKM Ac-2879]MBF4504155.1 phosphate ABC transporter permease PstA [Rathayibacter sp. VKM Ac-2878]
MTTTLPRLALPETGDDDGRVVIGFSRDDVLTVVGAMVAGLSVGLLFTVVIGIVPPAWMLLVSYLWFVGIYATLVFLRERGPAVRDRFWTVLLWSSATVVVGSLALVIVFTLISGQDVFAQMVDPASGQGLWDRLHFFTQDMGGVGPLAELDSGGILYALVGTIVQISIALVITIPLGLTTAIFLNEVGGRLARFVRTIVEAMTALPSVVAGLFIYAAVIVAVTRQFNGFAASLAITVLMLPIMIRSSDVVLRLVPGNLREAGLALGAGQWAVIWSVVLPTVRSGLTTAIILATAHGIGETAPVLLTAGVTSNLNLNPFDGPMTSLPLAALEFVKSSQNTMKARGFATAAFLLILVLVLFLIARAIGGQEPGNLTAQQRRRLARRSIETAARMRRSRRAAEQQWTIAAQDWSSALESELGFSAPPQPDQPAHPDEPPQTHPTGDPR